MRALLTRSRIRLLTLVSGGGLLVLEGCDPVVRETILTGVGGAATSLTSTFIQAFFESLMQTDEETQGTTVKAIIEYLPQIFA